MPFRKVWKVIISYSSKECNELIAMASLLSKKLKMICMLS
jgi:hypothetical protein